MSMSKEERDKKRPISSIRDELSKICAWISEEVCGADCPESIIEQEWLISEKDRLEALLRKREAEAIK